MNQNPARKHLKPVELIILQGTSFCNLNCSYCDLTVASRRTRAVMDSTLIERLFVDLFCSGRLAPRVTVVWHSGEPLTLSPAYYDAAITLILGLRDASPSRHTAIHFDIQTNGVLIDEAWCEFFKRHRDILDVGISCDGPAEMHDAHRVHWNKRPTHAKTLRGMDLLAQHGIKFKVIAVVTSRTLADPDAFYYFFFHRRDELTGFHFNVLASAEAGDAALAYSATDRERYYAFFRRLLALQETENRDAGFKILNFAQCLSRISAAATPGSASAFRESSAPLKSLNVDTQGNVTTFYAGLGVDVLPDVYGDGRGFGIGNIFAESLEQMTRSAKFEQMLRDFDLSARSCEASCEYYTVCTGGFEIVRKQRYDAFDVTETTECLIHVKTLADALLDDISERLDQRSLA
jgi:uncharacterized protein